MGAGIDTGATSTYYWAYDDVYVDATQARVEICNTATWATRTHCEIQIPVTWSSSSIGIKVNPGSFVSLANQYLYVVDSSGSVSTAYQISGDTTAPTITAFTIPSTSTSLTVNITTFTATDDTAVTGYCVNESATAPTSGSCGGSGWSATAQTSYVFDSEGNKTLYAWAKDAVGNISTSASDSVTVDMTPPVISSPLPSGFQKCTHQPKTVTLQVTTDENATCKYSTSDISYDSMTVFSSTGATTHTKNITVYCSRSYTYYFRCMDALGNKDTSSTSTTFRVDKKTVFR